MGVTVRVPAKINLSLRVGPARADGFHELATVFHAVSLCDEVTAADAPPEVDAELPLLTLGGVYADGLEPDDSNLATRAAMALAEAAGVPPRVRLHVRKSIPVAAGLAGGSADAAGVLIACNELWGLGWPVDRLRMLAAQLGSDVPFAVLGGTAAGTGRGERLRPVPVEGRWHWVLAIVDDELSTPRVYGRLDEMRAGGQAHEGEPVSEPLEPDDRLLRALAAGSVEEVAGLLRNDLQAAAVDLCPSVAATLQAGLDSGALAGLVSGSGPTCFFLARDAGHAADVADSLETSGRCASTAVVTGPEAVHIEVERSR